MGKSFFFFLVKKMGKSKSPILDHALTKRCFGTVARRPYYIFVSKCPQDFIDSLTNSAISKTCIICYFQKQSQPEPVYKIFPIKKRNIMKS